MLCCLSRGKRWKVNRQGIHHDAWLYDIVRYVVYIIILRGCVEVREVLDYMTQMQKRYRY